LKRTLASAGESRVPKVVIGLLLLSTFALSVHVQLARVTAFPAKHILHGDLRPDCDNHRQLFTEVDSAAHLTFALGIVALAAGAPRVVPAYVRSSIEPSFRKMLKYLSLFFRPPPLSSAIAS
jgi:hypothetical protein